MKNNDILLCSECYMPIDKCYCCKECNCLDCECEEVEVDV